MYFNNKLFKVKLINKVDAKHVCFIAKIKGTNVVGDLSRKEQVKISCARKHFGSISDNDIRYEVVKDYESLHKILNS